SWRKWAAAGLGATAVSLGAASLAAQAAGVDREDIGQLHFLALGALGAMLAVLILSRDGRLRDLERKVDNRDRAYETAGGGRPAVEAARRSPPGAVLPALSGRRGA